MTHDPQAAVDRAIVSSVMPLLYQAIDELLVGLGSDRTVPKAREYEIRRLLPPQYSQALKKET